MKRESVLSLSVLLVLLLCAVPNMIEVEAVDGLDTAKVYGVEGLWNSSMNVVDVAVSKDGNHMVAVNSTGLYYFASKISDPIWWYLSGGAEYFFSVVISADGQFVVAGNNTGHIYYFNDSRTETGERLSPTWISRDLYGAVERGTLDISDDGEYVVVAGTGVGLYYFAGCRERSGMSEDPTWFNIFGVNDFYKVEMSPDGQYVAAGGSNGTWNGFVMFYKGASSSPYPTDPDWISNLSGEPVWDLALSDDGYAVAAVTMTIIITQHTLYYWGNATNLSRNPKPTWTSDGSFSCVDMSADGDEVLTGTAPPFPTSLHFWSGARDRSGPDQEEDWIELEGETVLDAAMSDDGGIIVATSWIEFSFDSTAYFLKGDGSVIGEYELPRFSPLVSMSGDGRMVAIGDSGPLTLHVFEVLEDLTPPLIEDVYQEPDPGSVYPEYEVMVYTNVSDTESGVKNVFLNYTNGNGTWIIANMTNLEGNFWNCTIPAFEYCTYVNYTVVAEDKVGNIVTSEEVLGYKYQYHVIQEFPSILILPLFMMVTLLAVTVYKKKVVEV